MVDFRIATFLAVCKYMNYTKAAHALHITQPAVSQHIKYLEECYQTKLFITEGKKIRITAAGKLLKQSATAITNDDQLLKQRLSKKEPEEIPLHFGTTKTIGEFVIGKPLAGYMKHHYDSRIRMKLGNTSELLQELRDGTIQFALVEGYFSSIEYDSIVFRSEDYIAVCAKGHKFGKNPCEIEDLVDEKVLLREAGSGTRDILEKNLIARNVELQDFHDIVEVDSMNVIVYLVEQDCGIAFLYRAAVKEQLDKGTIVEIPLKDFVLHHDFSFIWEKESIFADDYKAICEELKLYQV